MTRILPLLPLLSAACLALAGCTTTVTTPAVPATATTPAIPATTTTVTTDPLQTLAAKISSIAIPDLQAALADAQAHNDAVASQCYSGLIPLVPQIQAAIPSIVPTNGLKGLATAFQAARDAKGAVSGIPALVSKFRVQINLACGALAMDVNASIADPLGIFTGQ